jgi:predicted enzyme related to lactoylglutathione lyase
MMQTSSRRRWRLGAAFAVSIAAFALAVASSSASAGKPDLSAMKFSSTPLTGKVIWNDLITDDLDTTRTFYGALFGWTFEHSSGKGGRYLLARLGDVYVAGIVEVKSRNRAQKLSRWLPYVSVTNVDSALSIAAAGGATVVVPARDVTFGRVAAIIDPQGAVIGLAQSRIGDPDDATTSPGLGRVVWTELLANDTDAAAQFYRDVVGYEPSTISRRGGQYTMLAQGGKNRAGLLKNPTDAKPVWLTYFGVDEPVAAMGRLEALGGGVIAPASPRLREGTMALVTDPAGALFVLQKVAQ